MKSLIITILLLFSFNHTSIQQDFAFKEGEWFKFKMSYGGWLKAGEGTLEINEETLNGKPVFHVVGKGKTTGLINSFFKVRDHFESYFDKKEIKPYKFIVNTYEGGYTKNIEIDFNYTNKTAIVKDKEQSHFKEVTFEDNVQDIISAFYYLRNNYHTDTIKPGDVIKLNMFVDEENFPFRLKFLGRETIRTKINGSKIKLKTLMFRPYVMTGEVFRKEESLTVWISDDHNKIPVKIKAELLVGSLRADLEHFKGLKHPFEVQID